MQHDQNDCGVACLASIIKYYGGEVDIERIRNLSGSSVQGTTLLGLFQAANQLGFDAEGLAVDDIRKLDLLNHPSILHVVIDNQLQHYIVYYGKNRAKKFIVADPATGICEFTEKTLEEIWKSKAFLKLTPNQSFQSHNEKQKTKLRWLFSLISPDLNLLLVALVLGIAFSSLGLANAIFLQTLIDDILPNKNFHKLYLSLFALISILISKAAVGYLRGLFLYHQARDFNNRIVDFFYKNLLNLPKSFFDSRKTGELVARLNDTRRIQMVISFIASNLLIDILVIISSLLAMYLYSQIIALVILIAIPLFLFLAYLFRNKIIAAQKEVMQGYAASESNYVDSIQGIDTIKVNNKESFFENINRQIYGSFQNKIFSLGKLNVEFGTIAEISSGLIIILVFGITSWLVIAKQLQLGEMIALIGLVGNSIPSVTRITMANIQIQEARIAFDRMFEYTNTRATGIDSSFETSQINHSNIGIESALFKVEDLNFNFPFHKSILKNISLVISPGEIVAILGKSGAGKSTLFQIFQRHYQPESGYLTLNGIDWNSLTKAEWSNYIGVVPQEIKIFNGSLLYNISLSDRQEDYSRVIQCCQQTGLEIFFVAFPQGYQTLLGESGVNISGGQKQLVALARALVKQPKMLLLDEVTSSLDRVSEEFVIKLLSQLRSRMAIVLITHKIRLASIADRIYILNNGEIEASGSPMDLLSNRKSH